MHQVTGFSFVTGPSNSEHMKATVLLRGLWVLIDLVPATGMAQGRSSASIAAVWVLRKGLRDLLFAKHVEGPKAVRTRTVITNPGHDASFHSVVAIRLSNYSIQPVLPLRAHKSA